MFFLILLVLFWLSFWIFLNFLCFFGFLSCGFGDRCVLFGIPTVFLDFVFGVTLYVLVVGVVFWFYIVFFGVWYCLFVFTLYFCVACFFFVGVALSFFCVLYCFYGFTMYF